MKMWGALLLMAAAAGAIGPVRAHSQNVPAEALISAGSMVEDGNASSAPDSQQYAEGKQAIHDGHWTEAAIIFGKIIDGAGTHAASAYYWKAYALNKTGKSDEAIKTCAELRNGYRKSSWIEDCDALQIEIYSSRGKPVPPQPDQSDESKLLALSALIQSDPKKATEQIKELVQSDASERLKEGAVFILGQKVPEATYPQIVRISYMEGDVRIARATVNEKSDKPAWETAVMNLPLSEGDSVVTGKDGRAEIEFEDASTMYVGENSVLNCIDLHTTGGVPHTELALVSGTLTTHLDSLMGGETFLIRTPTENLFTRYPQQSDLRITSYLDGMAVTTLRSGVLNLLGSNRVDLITGQTLFISEGRRATTPEAAGKTQDFAAFDAWVADRYAARSSASTEVMKEAGLQKPLPGLADMKGKGHFFECPPYGMCWEPDAPQARPVLAAGPTPPQTPKSARPSAGGPTAGTPAYGNQWFPCMAQWYPGMTWPGAYAAGYPWALCHSGDWIPYNDGYAWVASGRRHHHCPVRWVKIGGGGRVLLPLHPKDVQGKPPINRAGFQPVKGRDGAVHLIPVNVEPGKGVEVLKSPPREFRNPSQPVLARVDAPRMQASALHDNAKSGIVARTAIPMTFNHQQGFVTSHQIMQGSHAVAVNVPVGGHMGGGFSGGMSGGGFAAHSGAVGFGAVNHGGGFSGGGGGHVSSGAVSGGGGSFHGGGSVSTGSVSTSSASAPAPSSGASHK
jgi:hypothetical protein